ncbi:hypothetical protein CBS101457_000112 [Exobasidium rhododendri]|nr:hypothetical protein CBS101457_000112 [Exobasidium rhododendri]
MMLRVLAFFSLCGASLGTPVPMNSNLRQWFDYGSAASSPAAQYPVQRAPTSSFHPAPVESENTESFLRKFANNALDVTSTADSRQRDRSPSPLPRAHRSGKLHQGESRDAGQSSQQIDSHANVLHEDQAGPSSSQWYHYPSTEQTSFAPHFGDGQSQNQYQYNFPDSYTSPYNAYPVLQNNYPQEQPLFSQDYQYIQFQNYPAMEQWGGYGSRHQALQHPGMYDAAQHTRSHSSHPQVMDLKEFLEYDVPQSSSSSIIPPEEFDPLTGEYILQAGPQFLYDDEESSCWDLMTEDQRSLIAERVHQVRPYSWSYIRQQLSVYLKPHLAKDILSKDQDTIDRGIESFIPIDKARHGDYDDPWMKGLSNTQRKLVINKMAEATMQAGDKLRDVFLQQKVSPALARKILDAGTTTKECQSIAEKRKLYEPVYASNLPWQKGLSFAQKKALIQRMMWYGDVGDIGRKGCYSLLKKKKVTQGYGMTMLRANPEKFARIMTELKKRNAQLPV